MDSELTEAVLTAKLSLRKIIAGDIVLKFLTIGLPAIVIYRGVQAFSGRGDMSTTEWSITALVTVILFSVVCLILPRIARLRMDANRFVAHRSLFKYGEVKWDDVVEIHDTYDNGYRLVANGNNYYLFPKYYDNERKLLEFIVEHVSENVSLPDSLKFR